MTINTLMALLNMLYFFKCMLPSNSAAQLEALSEKHHPQTVNVATCAAHAHVSKYFLVNRLALGQFILNDSFLRLTAGLRGCTKY